MGRNKKPTALHVLNGNPSKIKDIGKNEPKPAPVVDEPEPPEWVPVEGKKLFIRIFHQLKVIGIITTVDTTAFEMMCYYYGKWREYIKEMDLDGEEGDYTNKGGATNAADKPVVKRAEKAKDSFLKLAAEFGIMPAARSRIEVKSTDEDIEEMEQLLTK